MDGFAGWAGRGVFGGVPVQSGAVSFLSVMYFPSVHRLAVSRLRRIAGDVSIVARPHRGRLALQPVGGGANARGGMDAGSRIGPRDDRKNSAGAADPADVSL